MPSCKRSVARRPRASDAASAWKAAARWSRTSRFWRHSVGYAASADGADVISLLYRRAPTWLAQMPWLASAPELAQLPQRNLGVTRDRMLREFAELVEELAFARPLILALDDLHWSDDSTLSLLELLAHRDETAQLMLIGTYRPAEATRARQPLEALAQGLKLRGQCRAGKTRAAQFGRRSFDDQRRSSGHRSRPESCTNGPPADGRKSSFRPRARRSLESDLGGGAPVGRLAGSCRF